MIEFLIYAPIILAVWLMGAGAIAIMLVLLWRVFNDR
jgi:hypothetical protein